MCSVGGTGPLGLLPGGGPKGPNLPYFQALVFWDLHLQQQLHFFASDHRLSCYSKLACYSCFRTLHWKIINELKTVWAGNHPEDNLQFPSNTVCFQLCMCLSSSFAYAIGCSELTVSEITTFVFASGDDLIVPKRGYQRNTINYELFAFFPVVF